MNVLHDCLGNSQPFISWSSTSSSTTEYIILILLTLIPCSYLPISSSITNDWDVAELNMLAVSVISMWKVDKCFTTLSLAPTRANILSTIPKKKRFHCFNQCKARSTCTDKNIYCMLRQVYICNLCQENWPDGYKMGTKRNLTAFGGSMHITFMNYSIPYNSKILLGSVTLTVFNNYYQSR